MLSENTSEKFIFSGVIKNAIFDDILLPNNGMLERRQLLHDVCHHLINVTNGAWEQMGEFCRRCLCIHLILQ